MKRYLAAAASAAFVLSTASAAVQVVENFEGLGVEGTEITSLASMAATITVQSNGSNDHAILFDTNNLSSADPDLEAPIYDKSDYDAGGRTPVDAGYILVISERDVPTGTADDESRGGKITFDFATGLTLFSVDFHDTKPGAMVSLFNGSGAQFDFTLNVDLDTNSAPNFKETLFFGTGVSDVVKMVVDFGRDSGGINDIVFESGDDISEVPVPGALPLMLTGAAVFLARRKRKKA